MKVKKKRIGSVIMIFVILLSVIVPVLATTHQSESDSETTLLSKLENNIIQIAAGNYHSLALKGDGTVWAWGWNHWGQCGTEESSIIPVKVKGLKDVVAIAAGRYHSLTLKKDGTVWAWGSNKDGQLGNRDAGEYSIVPVQVKGLKDVVAIAAGDGYSLGLKKDGTVWCWGLNESIQVIDGSNKDFSVPFQIKGLKDVVAIAAGKDYSLALKKDGTVWMWEYKYNYYEQLRRGADEYSPVPVQVEGLKDVVAIAAGRYHSLALKKDGTVWAWGNNYYGQLGNGKSEDSYDPVQVKNLKDVVAIAAGENHSLALKKDGTIWAWGDNEWGQLGNSISEKLCVPVQFKSLKDVVAIAAGCEHSLALKKDGTVWSWGNNYYGQLGNGNSIDSYVPVQVRGLKDVVAIATGNAHSLALKKDGTVWAWGNNEFGQLGNGTNKSSFVPVQVKGLKDVVAIAAGSNHSLVLKKDGTVWAWGEVWFDLLNENSRLVYSSVPVQIKGLKDVVAIAAGEHHSLGLKKDGTVWAWGDNFFGQLGNSPREKYSLVPVQVKGLKDILAIATGEWHSLAIKKDGTVWAWGENSTGQLGNETSGKDKYSYVPVQVKGIKDVLAISAGSYHSLALKKDGTVWGWGANARGQLGNGGAGVYSTVPVQVIIK
jgi:alpha-tubulin suppressor-like RCC1 family protein